MVIFILDVLIHEDDVINSADLSFIEEEDNLLDGIYVIEENPDSLQVDLNNDISSNQQLPLLPNNQGLSISPSNEQPSPTLNNQQLPFLPNNQLPQPLLHARNTRARQHVQPSPCPLPQIIQRQARNTDNDMPYIEKEKLRKIKFRPAHLQVRDKILKFEGDT